MVKDEIQVNAKASEIRWVILTFDKGVWDSCGRQAFGKKIKKEYMRSALAVIWPSATYSFGS